jgi:hypothetical protein
LTETTAHGYNCFSLPTTVNKPQANAICERLHQTVTNALRPSLHAHHPPNADEAALIIDAALQTAAYSARAAIHGSLKLTPRALVFHRDIISASFASPTFDDEDFFSDSFSTNARLPRPVRCIQNHARPTQSFIFYPLFFQGYE